jgi:hypothetical protein
MATVGIPEVPLHLDQTTQQFLQALRTQVIKLRSSQAPVAIPSNFKVTAQAFSNTLQFTRVPLADYYEVLWSSSPNMNGAHVVDIGNSAQWTDNVGQTGITRYYAVRARLNTGARSLNTQIAKSTTLPSATGVNPPDPPIPNKILVIDQLTGHAVPLVLDAGAAIRRNL